MCCAFPGKLPEYVGQGELVFCGNLSGLCDAIIACCRSDGYTISIFQPPQFDAEQGEVIQLPPLPPPGISVEA